MQLSHPFGHGEGVGVWEGVGDGEGVDDGDGDGEGVGDEGGIDEGIRSIQIIKWSNLSQWPYMVIYITMCRNIYGLIYVFIDNIYDSRYGHMYITIYGSRYGHMYITIYGNIHMVVDNYYKKELNVSS